jgi:hypothetical protein
MDATRDLFPVALAPRKELARDNPLLGPCLLWSQRREPKFLSSSGLRDFAVQINHSFGDLAVKLAGI